MYDEDDVTQRGNVHVRNDSIETAHEAAEALRPLADIQAIVRYLIEHDCGGGATASEMAADDTYLNTLHQRTGGLQKRISDVVRLGYADNVLDKDGRLVKRPSAYGRNMRAIRVTDKGREFNASAPATGRLVKAA